MVAFDKKNLNAPIVLMTSKNKNQFYDELFCIIKINLLQKLNCETKNSNVMYDVANAFSLLNMQVGTWKKTKVLVEFENRSKIPTQYTSAGVEHCTVKPLIIYTYYVQSFMHNICVPICNLSVKPTIGHNFIHEHKLLSL